MVRPMGEIQDLLTDKSRDIVRKGTYKEWNVDGANDFEEWTVIENDDITILEDVEALWQGIVGTLHTPLGYIDGVTLENYGSKLLQLRGMNINYHIAELAKVYIRDTIPQYQGYVLDFPKIKITQPHPKVSQRHTMQIYLEVKSVFGSFARVMYI